MGTGFNLIENGRKGAFYRGVQRFLFRVLSLNSPELARYNDIEHRS